MAKVSEKERERNMAKLSEKEREGIMAKLSKRQGKEKDHGKIIRERQKG